MTGDVTRDDRGTSRLAELYVRYAPPAQRLAYLLTGDPSRAEDLVQEAFVRMVGRFAHLRAPDAFDAYLRRTIVNLHTSYLRRLRLERNYVERERKAVGRSSVDAAPDLGVREDLWRALLDLPPRQRAALVLRFYEDLSERETAEVLGCSPAAAKALVARGMEALRDRIRREGT